MSNLISLSNYTTLGIGGNARVSIAYTVDDLKKFSAPIILGNGSNVLVSDKGVNGDVIINRANGFTLKNGLLYAQSGCNISSLSLLCAKEGYSGLEWAYLLPASVGGAIVANAGAFGCCVGDIVKSVGVFRDNEVVEIDGKDCGFSYRTSNFREQDIIVYAKFDLIKADKEKCLALIDNTKALRACQPKGKSAGCIYKTEDKSAGWYIERAGLKNKRVGDIFVSPVHAGFFINAGRGTAKDMVALMDYVEKKVQDKFNKVLVREINLIGEF